MANQHIGSSFESFIDEECLHNTEVVSDLLIALLDEYAAACEREVYATALSKTYSRRRQAAYVSYLKQYDELNNKNAISDDTKRVIEEKLDAITNRKT